MVLYATDGDQPLARADTESRVCPPLLRLLDESAPHYDPRCPSPLSGHRAEQSTGWYPHRSQTADGRSSQEFYACPLRPIRACILVCSRKRSAPDID